MVEEYCDVCCVCCVSKWSENLLFYVVCTRLRHSAPSKQNRRESIRLSERAAIRTAMADCKIISSGFRSHNNVSASFTSLSIIFLPRIEKLMLNLYFCNYYTLHNKGNTYNNLIGRQKCPGAPFHDFK